TILETGRSILKPFHRVFPATNAAQLFEYLKSDVSPDLILLDIEMPNMDGFETIKRLKKNEQFKEIPVIFLTAKNDVENESLGFDLGAVDFIGKPFSAPILLKRIENQMLIAAQHKEIKNYADSLAEKVNQKTDEVTNLQNAVIATVMDMVDFRDHNTGGHSTRTKDYLRILIEGMRYEGVYPNEIAKSDIESLLRSSQLHDIGKIAIPDNILNKPGKLSGAEFEIVKSHVPIGVEAVEKMMDHVPNSAFLLHARAIVGTHHEKWNGSGYPVGLSKEQIPLEGRLMAVADVYDALSADRPYRKALSHEETCKIIEDDSGISFDPAIIAVFKTVKDRFAGISHQHSNPDFPRFR
ncbi:MAG: response regulator, partial [Firmicutes bacterium]|nr:response regulator [Bacillota bacterium]